MPRSEERGGMAAHSEAEANSLLVYKSPAWKGGVLYCWLPAGRDRKERACCASGEVMRPSDVGFVAKLAEAIFSWMIGGRWAEGVSQAT